MSFAAALVGSGLGPDPDSSFEMALQEAIAPSYSETALAVAMVYV